MADHLKSEEDQGHAARRACLLYSVPAYEPANDTMPANSTERKRDSETQGDSNLTEKPPRESPESGDILGISASGPEPARAIGLRSRDIPSVPASDSKRLKLNGPKPRIRRINTRFTIPGTGRREYTRGGKTYVCPPGIEPWKPEHRRMLDPQKRIFRQIGRFHYVVKWPPGSSVSEG